MNRLAPLSTEGNFLSTFFLPARLGAIENVQNGFMKAKEILSRDEVFAYSIFYGFIIFWVVEGQPSTFGLELDSGVWSSVKELLTLPYVRNGLDGNCSMSSALA